MPTFSNTPIPPTEPVTAEAASETVKARENTEEAVSKAAFRVPPSDGVTVQHFREAPDATVTKLNADLGLSLDTMRFARLKSFFTHSVRRDPTVGELRLLDALDRSLRDSPKRLAVGELITESETLATTWAEMMERHGILHGVGNAFRGTTPVAAPPCSLTEALSLEGLYLYRTGLRLPPDDGLGSTDSRTVLLSCPEDEAVAAAEGYTAVARISFGKDTRSLWVRSCPPSESPSLRPGDFLLYLPGLTSNQVYALRSRLDALPIPSAVLAPVAASSLLLTALEICPSLDLYADRLTEYHTSLRGSRLPVELLCTPPTPKADHADHLLRVSLKQIKPVTELIKELGLSATVCGQARTGEQTVIRVRNPGGKEDIPVVRLPTEFVKATAAVYLRPFEAPRQTANPPAPVYPPVSRTPSPHPTGSGITPDGQDLTPLTLHYGRLVTVPEANAVLSGAYVTIPQSGMGYAAAANTAAAVTDTLLEAGVPPVSMLLSVSVTLRSATLLKDSRLIEILCGINRLAADRAIPVDDSVIRIDETAAEDLRLSVVAWGQATELCENTLLTSDRLWRSCGESVHKESPSFLIPFLSPACEDSLKALCATLNRDYASACSLLPITLTPREEGSEAVSVPDSAGIRALCDGITGWSTPIFAMSAANAALLLEHPTVREALNRRIHLGYPILVLGEACRAFAEWDFLPPVLRDLKTMDTACEAATVIYHFEADGATRLMRCPPIAPADHGTLPPHLLTLHLPDGRTVPDGFTYRDSRVLGLINGLDSAILPRLRCRNRFD